MTDTSTQTSAPATPMKVHIDPSWRPILEEICLLKDALDHAFRWHGEGGNDAWIDDALRPHGLNLKDFAEGSKEDGPTLPDSFVAMLLGRAFCRRDLQSSIRLMEIPPWAVLGWVRKDLYKETPSLPREDLELRALAANQCDGTESSVDVWTGLPLYVAGEGKNRTQLQRLAGVDRLARVVEHPFPEIPGFTASPVPFFPWAVAIQSDNRPIQVLPFREITEKLVLKLGLKWDPKPSWRALTALMQRGDRPLRFLRWAAHGWQTRPGHALRLRLIAGDRNNGGTRLADALLGEFQTPSP